MSFLIVRPPNVPGYLVATTCGISRHTHNTQEEAAKEKTVGPIMLLDEWSQHMAPLAHLVSINQDFQFELEPYGSAAYPLCADLISEHFTPTREKHTYLMRMCTSVHKQIWIGIWNSDKKHLHASLLQRIQVRWSEVNVATGLQIFNKNFTESLPKSDRIYIMEDRLRKILSKTQ